MKSWLLGLLVLGLALTVLAQEGEPEDTTATPEASHEPAGESESEVEPESESEPEGEGEPENETEPEGGNQSGEEGDSGAVSFVASAVAILACTAAHFVL